jgi:hypothetical protein
MIVSPVCQVGGRPVDRMLTSRRRVVRERVMADGHDVLVGVAEKGAR